MAIQSDANAENAVAKNAVFESISKLEEIGASMESMKYCVYMTFAKKELWIKNNVPWIIDHTNIAVRDRENAMESFREWLISFQKSSPDLTQKEVEKIILEIRPDLLQREFKHTSHEVPAKQHVVPPDSSSFNSPVSAPIPAQSHIEEKFDESQFSTAQIESMLEIGKFLYRNGFKLKDRDSALRFVAKLISSDLIRQSTLDSLNADNHAEFQSLLDRCTQSSKLESANSPRELNSRRIIDGISKILSVNQIPIPSDIDSFIFKLSTLSEFRSKICSKFNEKARTKIFQLCELLLKLERSDANVTR